MAMCAKPYLANAASDGISSPHEQPALRLALLEGVTAARLQRAHHKERRRRPCRSWSRVTSSDHSPFEPCCAQAIAHLGEQQLEVLRGQIAEQPEAARRGGVPGVEYDAAAKIALEGVPTGYGGAANTTPVRAPPPLLPPLPPPPPPMALPAALPAGSA